MHPPVVAGVLCTLTLFTNKRKKEDDVDPYRFSVILGHVSSFFGIRNIKAQLLRFATETYALSRR